jgi:hypothetical protein
VRCPSPPSRPTPSAESVARKPMPLSRSVYWFVLPARCLVL